MLILKNCKVCQLFHEREINENLDGHGENDIEIKALQDKTKEKVIFQINEIKTIEEGHIVIGVILEVRVEIFSLKAKSNTNSDT